MVDGRDEQVSPARVDVVEGYEFLGDTFERTVDDKGRIVLPAGPQRDAYEGRAWITLYRGCLALWTRRSYGAYLRLVEDQEEAEMLPPRSLEAIRRSTAMVTIDAQGRFGLPAGMREARGIGGHGSKVVVEGQGDRLEIRAVDRPDEAMPDPELVVGMTKHR